MKNSNLKLFVIVFSLLCFIFGLNSPQAFGENKKVIANPYSASISWVTDKPSTTQVEYGTSASYGSETKEDINLVTHHKITLYNLKASTLYHYRVKSRDASGNEGVSRDFTFMTLKEPHKDAPPQISDVEAESIMAAGEPTDESEQAKPAGQLVKQEEPIEKALIQKGGILLKKGKKQIESSVTYAHVSANRIALQGYTIFPVLVVGEISSEEVKRDIFIETLAMRYGLRNDLQVQVSVPFRQQLDRVTVGTSSDTTRSSAGIGDIEAGIFHQFAYEQGGRPDMIAGLSVKSNTGREPYNRSIGLGTGHWAVKGSLVAVKSTDPAIIFSKLGYTYNFKRNDISNYGTVEPGQTFDYGLGVAFALNYQLAISAQLEQALTTKLRVNHSSVPGSFTNVVNFKYGFTWSINRKLSCDVSATHGLTPDAPNFVLEVRFPYTF